MDDNEQESGQPAVGVESPRVVKGRVPVRRPDIDTIFSINPDGSRNAIHPADVKGRFQIRKHLIWLVMLGIYLVVPWLKIGGNPVLLIDIPARHFYLLGYTFNAQDFWLAFFFISGLGFTLFVVASLWGRIWCGYACPQTVFLEGVFRRIERWIEGPAAARRKLDAMPMNARKAARRGLKMAVYLAVCIVLTHSFLGYFMPIEKVVAAMEHSPGNHPVAFGFALVSTLLMFVNFAWFREQLCIVVCPYGRLQAALYDADTVLVGYDAKRGDPRGPVGAEGAGDCVDCYRCVAVCPTGIDIRNGTQLECVGCANCIDACDAVMSKIGRPRGLVRYDSQRGFETGTRKFVRGRVILYAFLMLLGMSVFGLAVTARKPFEANLTRSLGTIFTLADDEVRSTYELQLINKRPVHCRFTVEVVGPEKAKIELGETEVELDSLEEARFPVSVSIPTKDFRAGMRCELLVKCFEGDEVLERLATVPMAGPIRRTRPK